LWEGEYSLLISVGFCLFPKIRLSSISAGNFSEPAEIVKKWADCTFCELLDVARRMLAPWHGIMLHF